jgi:hypothetical protein
MVSKKVVEVNEQDNVRIKQEFDEAINNYKKSKLSIIEQNNKVIEKQRLLIGSLLVFCVALLIWVYYLLVLRL